MDNQLRPGDIQVSLGAADEGEVHCLGCEESQQKSQVSEADGGSSRSKSGKRWGGLNDDALLEVFRRLPFEDRLRTVPLVCKDWRSTSHDPSCWRIVDMDGWFDKRVDEDYWWEFECEPEIEAVVRKAVDRSCGQLVELRVRHCSEAAINYIADRCPTLKVLSIPNSLFVTDKSLTNLASKCPKLQELDVSDCYNISNQALKAVGLNCTSLVWLGRNMVEKTLKINREHVPTTGPIPGGDEEAIVVAKHMVNLEHLEMMKTSLSNRGLAYLARGCGQLKSLNLACCTSLSPEALARVTEKCPNIVDFTKPIPPRMHVDSNLLRVLFG